jgi:transposase
LSTKIHATVDALGNPVRCLLSGGQVADITHAQALIIGIEDVEALLADKAYDANALLEYLAESGIAAVIPPKANRKEQRGYDRHLYKDRNLVERFFNRIKQFRRIATRYEKLARNFFSMLCLVCAYIWLA